MIFPIDKRAKPVIFSGQSNSIPFGNRTAIPTKEIAMQIEMTTSEELSRHEYHTVETGRVYHAPGRVLIVTADDAALLIETEAHQDK